MNAMAKKPAQAIRTIPHSHPSPILLLLRRFASLHRVHATIVVLFLSDEEDSIVFSSPPDSF
jgi:hypothetical protein